jgi:hypothetical protein
MNRYTVVSYYPKLVQMIQDVLSPNLLDHNWQRQVKKRPLSGYCYIASEALYYLLAKEEGFKPAQMWVHVGNGIEISHWFLRKKTGEVLDITASQFGKTRIPYHKAKGCGFLTNYPSEGAAEIMRRLPKSVV